MFGYKQPLLHLVVFMTIPGVIYGVDTCLPIKNDVPFLPQLSCNGTNTIGLDVGQTKIIDFLVNRYPSLGSEAIEDCLDEICDGVIINCEANDYPSFDGTCNNLAHPTWGSVGKAQRRDLAPLYNGGWESARLNRADGQPLPNARYISNTVLNRTQGAIEDPYFTEWVPAFAQLVTHDISLTPMMTGFNGEKIDCNSAFTGCTDVCLEVTTEADDPHFGDDGTSGLRQANLNFVRSQSTPCCTETCTRTPINSVSAYIDGSTTYGDSIEEAASLRENNGAGSNLIVGPFENGGTYLPKADEQTICFDGGSDSQYCTLTGDSRHLQNPPFGTLLTLFLREHNRVADKLRELNPNCVNDTLYHEARKIVRAMYQKIGINDVIAKVVLGDTTAETYELNEKSGYDNCYNNEINAQASVAFTTAASRFGHGLVNKLIGQYEKKNKDLIVDELIQDTFDKVEMNFKENGVNGVARYQCQHGMKPVDGKLSGSVRNDLFKTSGKSSDLGAMNTMRGRDHGLPGYNAWRSYCNLAPFPASHNEDTTAKIREVYEEMDDEIDVFVGGLTETPKPGALVGDLFSCLIGQQFQKLKQADRFYYQNEPNGPNDKGRFQSEAQVLALQKVTLARLICDNTDTTKVQPDVFRTINKNTNKLTSCNNKNKIPELDLTAWKDSM